MVGSRIALALMACVLFSGSLQGADSPLAGVSNDADIVVRLKAPKATIEKAAAMADAVQPGMGAPVRANGPALGVVIQNPALAGVDQTKDWYIVMTTQGPAEPTALFVVPTTNAADAAGALPPRFTSKEQDGWLMYSEDASALPNKVDAAQSLAAVMRGEAAAVFDRGDLSVFINIDNLTGKYADEIEMAQMQVQQLLQQLPNQIPSSPGVNMQAIFDMYGGMAEHVFQGVNDASHCTIALSISDAGLDIEDYLAFAKGSQTSSLLAGHPRSSLASLGYLPADTLVAFGMSGDGASLMTKGMAMSASITGSNEGMKEAFAEFEKSMTGVKIPSFVGGFTFGQLNDGLFRMVSIIDASPAEKFRDASRGIAKKLGKMEVGGMTQETRLEADAESAGGTKVDVTTVTQTFDENFPGGAMQQQVQAMMFGPNGMQTRSAYLKDKVVQTFGGGAPAMSDQLKRVGGAPSSEFAAHREGLIADPNLLVMLDAPGLAVEAMKRAQAIPGVNLPFGGDVLNSLKFKKSFIGFTMAAEPDAVRAKTRIPTAQVQGIVAMVFGLQAAGPRAN